MARNKKQSGFTLIELLVVISVLALLASVILLALSSSRVKARNAKRSADIKTLVSAFQANEATFPVTGQWVCVSATCLGDYSSFFANSAVDTYLSAYLLNKPVDPPDATRPRGGYMYGNVVGPINAYDGSSMPAGAFLDWVVEPPQTATSCGVGKIGNVTATYIECLLRLGP